MFRVIDLSLVHEILMFYKNMAKKLKKNYPIQRGPIESVKNFLIFLSVFFFLTIFWPNKVLYLARILLNRKKKKLTKKFENLKTGVRNQPFFLYISAVSQFRGYICLQDNTNVSECLFRHILQDTIFL